MADPLNPLQSPITLVEVITVGPQGMAGPPGETGPAGPSGTGIPAGGSPGQVLVKTGLGDQEADWSGAIDGGTFN